MYEDIIKLIKLKRPNIDNESLSYFANYFYILAKNNILPSEIKFEDVIDNAFRYAQKVEFYDENHWVYKKLGGDVKGFRDPDSKIIFIRNNLPEPLREITVYHELHHAIQTNPENDMVGINQESNIGRLIMEAQTQYFAEKIYQEMHNVKFEEKEIPSENLRMLPGGTIISSFHNYEMYDSLLSKLAIILGVSKDYFVSINYLYRDNLGLKDLERRYNEVKAKLVLPYEFNNLMFGYDLIYCTDLHAYVENEDKEIILSGQTTKNKYTIYPDKHYNLSLGLQKQWLEAFDTEYFIKLYVGGGNFREFVKYVFNDQNKKRFEQFIQQQELKKSNSDISNKAK